MKLRPLVLVIDDSQDSRRVTADVLRLSGFNVQEAADGLEGILKASLLRPDLIVTDLEMPTMDGWETIRRLRSHVSTCRIPVIACSGAEPARRATDPVRDARLGKLCEPDTLVNEVRAFLRAA
jgi:CheY-like chemotaxis protein